MDLVSSVTLCTLALCNDAHPRGPRLAQALAQGWSRPRRLPQLSSSPSNGPCPICAPGWRRRMQFIWAEKASNTRKGGPQLDALMAESRFVVGLS
jgi:hypothetical protein